MMKNLEQLVNLEQAIAALKSLTPEEYGAHSQKLIKLRDELRQILEQKYHEWYKSEARKEELIRRCEKAEQRKQKEQQKFDRVEAWVVKNLKMGDIIKLKGTRSAYNSWRVVAGFDRTGGIIGDFIEFLDKTTMKYRRRGGSAVNGAGNVTHVYRDGELIFTASSTNDASKQ